MLRLLDALWVTFLLAVPLVLVSVATGEPLFGLPVVLAIAIWAAIDSSRLELHKYSGETGHPVFVFLAVACLWIIYFPVYLVTRSRRIAGELKLKKKYRDDAATALDTSGEHWGNRFGLVSVAATA